MVQVVGRLKIVVVRSGIAINPQMAQMNTDKLLKSCICVHLRRLRDSASGFRYSAAFYRSAEERATESSHTAAPRMIVHSLGSKEDA